MLTLHCGALQGAERENTFKLTRPQQSTRLHVIKHNTATGQGNHNVLG